MNIWLLGTGEGDDFGIQAVFSSEDKIKKVAEQYNLAGERVSIESMELDVCENYVFKNRYRAEVNLETGAIKSNVTAVLKTVVDANSQGYLEIIHNKGVAISYISLEHAIKLAASIPSLISLESAISEELEKGEIVDV